MSCLYILLIFFTALTFSLLAVPFMIRFAHSKKLYDLPDNDQILSLSISRVDSANNNKSFQSRRVHIKPIPRLGGIAIVFGFFISLAIWKTPTNMVVIYICSFIMFLTGLVDDIHTLSAKFRLAIQFCVSTTTVIFTHSNIQNITLSQNIHFQLPVILGFFLSIFIIIGAINSINMIDGLDGLAAGVVLIGISLLSYLYFLSSGDVKLLVTFSIPIIGAILGFLKYNTHPSSIFMGDCGSNWLGFMVGVFILIVANQFIVQENNGSWTLINASQITALKTLPFLSILMCLSIPVFDTGHVIFLRLLEGKNPMSPDKRHFHHALMKIGFSHSQSVVIVYFLMILFGILGILPVAYKQYNFSWTPFVGLVLLGICILFAQKLSEGFISNLISYKLFLNSQKQVGVKISLILKYWENLNRYTIYLILFATPVFAGVVPTALGYAAAAMCLVLCCTILFQKSFSFFEALVIAIAATVLLTANNSNSIWIELLGNKYNLQSFYNGLFIWLISSSVLFFIVTFKRKYLFIAPTDFLLALLPLVLLLLPADVQNEYRLNIIALRSLVLFAALRTLGKRHGKFFYKVHFISIIALAWIALTSLIGLRIIY